MRLALFVIGVAATLPGALVSVHYTILAAASLLYRERRAANPPRLRFLVLIPAHDEEAVINRTLTSLAAAIRPGDEVLVVDDRSSDRTGEIVRSHGVRMLRREPDQTPGRAAARQDGIALALTLPGWDAMATIDADSVVQPGYFETIEAVLGSGADAVQVRSEAVPAAGVVSQATLAAFALQGITIPRGRDRLNLSVRLKGTGLAVRRSIVQRYGFRGPGAGEDLWFSNDLLLDGIVARHVDSTRLRSESPARLRSASMQRVRWEAGRMLAAREFLLPLLRSGTPASFEAAVHLVTVPYALAVSSLGVGSILLGLSDPFAAAVPLVLLVLLGLVLCLGLVQARAPLAAWLALLMAPAYVVFKVWIQFNALATILRHERSFPATPRG